MYDGPVVRGGARWWARAAAVDRAAGAGPGRARAGDARVLNQLRGLADSPGEIQVEFAIKLTTDARIIIAKAGA